jgi:NAD(P)-dependent dehydrogenase (short-subunit alcohol dehydrogenase family)
MSQYSGIRHRRVLITGATSGLGFAMAKALVSEGARVFLTGRDPDRVNRALSELRSLPGECQGQALDVRDEQSIRAGLAEMLRIWGGIDVLINNAGIGMRTVSPKFLTDPKLFWEIPAQGFRNLIDTNLTGGATATGMIPDEVPASMRPQILSPDVMAEPVVFLCSDEAQGMNDQRVVAKEFAHWKTASERAVELHFE